ANDQNLNTGECIRAGMDHPGDSAQPDALRSTINRGHNALPVDLRSLHPEIPADIYTRARHPRQKHHLCAPSIYVEAVDLTTDCQQPFQSTERTRAPHNRCRSGRIIAEPSRAAHGTFFRCATTVSSKNSSASTRMRRSQTGRSNVRDAAVAAY